MAHHTLHSRGGNYWPDAVEGARCSDEQILVFDEEPQMRRLLQCGFTREGHEVDAVGNYDSALERVARGGFNLLVLDVGVPGCGGSDVIERFRAWSGLPVIVLSVPENVEHKVALLGSGADDFVEKPFAIEELAARIHSLLRRSEVKVCSAPVLRFDEHLEVDLSRPLVVLGGEALHLTPTEYRLLEVLVRNAKKLLTQELLLRRVWGPGYSNQHEYLRTYVPNQERSSAIGLLGPAGSPQSRGGIPMAGRAGRSRHFLARN